MGKVVLPVHPIETNSVPRGLTIPKSSAGAASGRVVEFVRRRVEADQLKPGDRLPAERTLARQVGVSRPSLRSGLRTLRAMGVVHTRQGSGTFVVDGPPRLSEGPLRFLAVLHRFGRDEIFEARRVLEVAAAGLAAEHATPEQIISLAEEVTGMFASLNDPQTYLVHDVQFHRTIGAGSGNRVLEVLVNTVSELVYQKRKTTAERATDLREATEMHRRLYRAIRGRDREGARGEMASHLDRAREAEALEEQGQDLAGTSTGAPEGPGALAPRERADLEAAAGRSAASTPPRRPLGRAIRRALVRAHGGKH